MTDLLKAEFLRLVSRRLTWALLFVTVAFAALVTLMMAGEVRALTADDYALAQQQYGDYVAFFDSPECTDHPGNCGSPEGVTVANFLRVPVDYETYMSAAMSAAPLVLVAIRRAASSPPVWLT